MLGLGMAVSWTSIAAAEDEPSGQTSGTLADNVATFALELGRPVQPEAVHQLAALPASVAGEMSTIVDALLECHRLSARLEVATLLESPTSDPAAEAHGLRGCADRLDSAVAHLQRSVRARGAETLKSLQPIDAWPVLRFSPSASDDVYLHDYLLIIDLSGNDSYFNNAGGNLVDVVRGPDGSSALVQAPAAGCQNIPALARGMCTVSAAAILDMGGDDVYGRLEPSDEDSTFVGFDGKTASCTTDMLVRRIVTEGSGLAGVGLLVDESGDDSYLGKTLSQGSGHAWGIGTLRDYGAGDDTYTAIRSSQGFGLVGQSVGTLWDEGGDDSYNHYMPAGDETHPGGVISDKGVCDSIPRNLQAVGLIGGQGVLEDLGGSDRYSSASASQAYGTLGGSALFWDRSGRDIYEGPVGRANDTTVVADAQSTGVFIDEDPSGSNHGSLDERANDGDLEGSVSDETVDGGSTAAPQGGSPEAAEGGQGSAGTGAPTGEGDERGDERGGTRGPGTGGATQPEKGVARRDGTGRDERSSERDQEDDDE